MTSNPEAAQEVQTRLMEVNKKAAKEILLAIKLQLASQVASISTSKDTA